MTGLETAAAALAAELRRQWPLEGDGLELWLARVLALGIDTAGEQRAAIDRAVARGEIVPFEVVIGPGPGAPK